MRFEMCAVDHEAFWNTGLRCQSCENLLENAAPAPAEKPVVEGGVIRTLWVYISTASRYESHT